MIVVPSGIFSRRTLRYAAVFLLIGAALYFRTYVLQGISFQDARSLREKAREAVVSMMKRQLKPVVDAQFPMSDKKTKEELVERKVDEVIRTEKAKFESSVAEIAKSLFEETQAHYTPQYLSEADPYYYLGLTENVLKTGWLGTAYRKGRFLNPLRYLPDGSWDEVTLHVYLGTILYKGISFFAPKISLVCAVACLPLILGVLIIPAYLPLAKASRLSFPAALTGCVILVLSPLVIQRSVYGWYDTDPYNVIFPALILSAFFHSFSASSGKKWIWGVIAGSLSGFYALFWAGWSFIFLLTAGVSLLVGVLEIFGAPPAKRRPDLAFFLSYAAATILFAALLVTPSGLFEMIAGGFRFIAKVSGGAASVWPNFYLLIGETNTVSPLKWIYLVSNWWTLLLALMGAIAALGQMIRDRSAAVCKIDLAWILITLPLLFLSLKAERYVLLVVLPFSFWAARGADWLMGCLGEVPFRGRWSRISPKVRRTLAVSVVFLIFLPRTFVGADVGGKISHIIMNDAWYGALTAVRDRTPPDSIVFSWWSPGHFVTGVARRRVAVDGGSQAMRENYWICKALMATDENTAAGIFRMLAAGGNRAADLFEKQGWSMARAQKLILSAVRVSRDEARKLLPEEWPGGVKEELLDATHGSASPRPSYLMIYDELLVDNVILQMNANWDFEKAEAVYRKQTGKNPLANMFKEEQTDYVRRLIEISGQPNVYQVGLNLNSVLGSQMIFENGLVINTATKEAYHMVPAPGKQGMNLEPLDLYLRDDGGQWQMVPNPKGGANARIVAIYYKQGQAVKGAIVQKDLLETLLFKLFFFEGQDLNRFKLFTSSYDPKSKNTVQIFEINY